MPAGLIAALALWGEPPAAVSMAIDPPTTLGRCVGSVRENCIVDGDTIWLDGVKIRIADIDTPETSRPGCAREAQLGEQATVRLTELLNAAPFETVRPLGTPDRDRYDRLLREVRRDGKSLGDRLVAEGLAERWGGPRIDWCA